jgi:hypothetical protein
MTKHTTPAARTAKAIRQAGVTSDTDLKSLSDAQLLEMIDAAAKAANESGEAAAKAQEDRVAKCKATGYPLLELKRRYPKVKDFQAKLKECPNLIVRGRSTAYDYMRLVGGRKTDDQIAKAEQEKREAAKLRKRKSRAALPKPARKAKVDPKISVTKPSVTDKTGETKRAPGNGKDPSESAKERMAENAARFAEADLSLEERSDGLLKAFKEGEWADQYRKMLPADSKRARVFFNEFTMKLDSEDAKREAA